MKQIIEVGKEIRDLQFNVSLVYSIMGSVIFFLAALLFAAFFEIPYHWFVAIISTLVFFYFYFRKIYSKQNILEVVAKTPELREKLRTSLDYANKDNEIVSELHKDVLGSIKILKL